MSAHSEVAPRTVRIWPVVRLTLGITSPAILGFVAAVAVYLMRANGEFTILMPLTTVTVGSGCAISVAVGVGVVIGRALRRREARGRELGSASERAAHRRFLARLDHELKNPVTAIRAALETEPHPTPSLRAATGQADRLAQLISELRSLSSLEDAQIERVPFDVSAVVHDEVVAFCDYLRAQKLVREVETHLPSAPWPLPTVVGDADLLAVAVRNLLINAARYSDPGARIEVRGSEQDGFVVIEVADTGWGIPAEELPQVWDELWRGKHRYTVDGSGLGLSLVRVVANLHHGGVTIRSREGTGTSVQIWLPI